MFGKKNRQAGAGTSAGARISGAISSGRRAVWRARSCVKCTRAMAIRRRCVYS